MKDNLDEAYKCIDCSDNTRDIREYYMVKHEVWAASGVPRQGGMLCIGCLEIRLKRELTPEDFLECPLNDFNVKHGSVRLLSRLVEPQ